MRQVNRRQRRALADAPSRALLQEILPGFAEVQIAFCKAALALTRRIARLLSKVLNESDSWLEKAYFQAPFAALHNLHYAPIKSEPDKGILGLGRLLFLVFASSITPNSRLLH